MKWNHIMDKQPEHGERIIQIDYPYSDEYCIGIGNYYQKCSFQEVVDYYQKHNLGEPDFWWIHAKDLPFPAQPERSKREDPEKGCGALNTEETQ